MPEKTDFDPALIRIMRGRMGRPTNTLGAGAFQELGLPLGLMSPRIAGGGGMGARAMGGANFAKPGAGATPSLKGAPDSTVQGEFGPDELKSLAAPYTPGMDVVKPDSGATENILRLLRGVTANDPRNIMKDKLELSLIHISEPT